MPLFPGRSRWLDPATCRGEIEPVEHNPVVNCQHCEDSRQYLTSACLLAPMTAAAHADKTARALALVAGLVAAVKLARVKSRGIQYKSPRVRAAISDSLNIARMIVEAAKGNR